MCFCIGNVCRTPPPLLKVRAWQVLRLPPLERAVANFVREVLGEPSPRNSSNSSSSNKRKSSPNEILESLTEIIERLQYVITEGCFDDLREMVIEGVE